MTAIATEAEIRRDLADVSSLVHAAGDILARGEPIALTDLEERVARSCQALASLPRTRARAFEAPLVVLIDEIEKLSKSLNERHQSLKNEIDSLGRRRRAATAYAKTGPKAGGAKSGPR